MFIYFILKIKKLQFNNLKLKQVSRDNVKETEV